MPSVQVKVQLVAEREEMARFAAEAHSIQGDHQRELESKDAIMQEVLTAMQGEEQAKMAAQEQLQGQKEHLQRLERELASTGAKHDDLKETVKDLEMEREELQVCIC